jgi:hypothetical protein
MLNYKNLKTFLHFYSVAGGTPRSAYFHNKAAVRAEVNKRSTHFATLKGLRYRDIRCVFATLR